MIKLLGIKVEFPSIEVTGEVSVKRFNTKGDMDAYVDSITDYNSIQRVEDKLSGYKREIVTLKTTATTFIATYSRAYLLYPTITQSFVMLAEIINLLPTLQPANSTVEYNTSLSINEKEPLLLSKRMFQCNNELGEDYSIINDGNVVLMISYINSTYEISFGEPNMREILDLLNKGVV